MTYTTKSQVYLYPIPRVILVTLVTPLAARRSVRLRVAQCNSASTSQAFWNYYNIKGHWALLDLSATWQQKGFRQKRLAFPIYTRHWLTQPWKSRCSECMKLTKESPRVPSRVHSWLLQPYLLVQLTRNFHFSGL